MIAKPLPSRLMGCLVFLMALSLSCRVTHADRILSRHTRAMMIDMRGFPDTEPFVCKGAGFQRNETDCTQFFRCVDFNNNGKHTIFRFMCGPMAVFDESRSLCTGPELSVPPCPKDQLDAFFVSMKPMDPGVPAPPAPPAPPSPPPTIPTARPPVVTPTLPPVTAPPITVTIPVITTPTPTKPNLPPIVVISSTEAPVTVPVSPVTPAAPIPTSPPEVVTIPTVTKPEVTLPIVTTTPEAITTTTQAPVVTVPVVTVPVVTVPPVTVSVVTAPPVTVPVVTAPPVTVPVVTTPPVTVPVVTTPPVTVPVVTTPAPTLAPVTTPPFTLAPVTDPAPAKPTQAPVTVPPVTAAPPTPSSTTEAITTTTVTVIVTEPPPTTTTETISEGSSIAPVVEVTSPETPAVTTTPVTTITIPSTVVIPSPTEDIKGFITIGGKEVTQIQQLISTVTVVPGVTWAVTSQGDGSKIVIKEDGSSETTFSVIPPGSFLMINTTQTGGSWSNIANGLFTTNSTTTSFPPGTTFSIVKVGPSGQVISWQTILTTTSTSTLTVPTNSFVGSVQFVNQKVVTIGGWTFTTTYFTTDTTVSSFGVLQPSTPSTSSQTTITTTSTVITGDQQFISGIITVGAQGVPSEGTKEIRVAGGDLLAIIPHGGQGIITLIEEGSTSSTDFPITPGSFLGVLAPSNGAGIVTNVDQSIFTSNTTTITFPAGSTVSILKVGVDGKLVRVSFVQLTSAFTLFTKTQSVVGMVVTTSTGVISNIGTGSFSTQPVAGLSKPIYFGIVNIHPKPDVTQVESLSGIIQIGDSTFLRPQESTTNVQTIQILPGTSSAILVLGEIKVTEEDGTSIKQTAISIPSGGILGIVTQTNGGEITGISNGYFTTTTTQLVFPFGTRFGIVIILPDGTMSLQQPIDTTIKTTITVPVGSVFGVLTLSSQGVVTGIGSASFSTQYLLLSDSTGPNVPATLGNFGVVYFSEQFKLSQSTVINSASVLQQLQTISVIVQLGVKDSFDSVSSLSVPSGTSFAIIPRASQGVVTVTEGGATSTFTVLPGQLFTIFNVQDATITNIGDRLFTTTTTTLSFGPGSQYGIIKIGLEGQIILTEFTRTAQSVISIVVSPGSTVGTIQQTTDSKNIITSIGGAPFAIKIMNTVNPLASSEFTWYAAVLDIGSATTIVPSPITSAPDTPSGGLVTPVPTVPVVTIPVPSEPITPEVVTSTSSPITTTASTPEPAADDIKGFLTIGEKEVIQNTQQVTPSINVPSGSTWGVVSQGTGSQIVIREQGSSETTVSVPAGAILVINTTQSGGVWNNVANGLFTTSSTTTSFPPGTTFSIVKVGATGQIISTQTILTTTSTCSLTVPTNTFVGSVQFFNQRVVTIGGWTFTTSYFTTGTTTSSFGVLQPTTTTTNSQTVITTTSTAITGDQQFVSGFITVGGPVESSQPTEDLTVPSGNVLAIIPQGGKGIVTIVGENQQEFTITPGTFLGVLTPSNGVGTVTNVVKPMFTSATTTITFPAGSSVSVFRVGIDGKLIQVSVVQFTTTFTIITSSQSFVGLVGTTSSGTLQNIGTGSFSTQTLTGSSASVVFGVLNLNSVETSQVESLFGFLQVGDATFLSRQESAVPVQTLPIPADSTSAIMASGDIKVTEESETSSRQTTFSLTSGGIFGMVSTTGGEISGISNGYFTTSQTKITFPSGATLGIMMIRPDGTMIVQNPIVTKDKTTITVPLGSIYGLIVLSAQNVVTGIGAASFTTENLLVSDSTGPDVPAVLGNFGVMYFREQFQLSQSIVISSAQFSAQPQTISAIIQLGVNEQFASERDLAVPAASSFGIIPYKEQRVVTVNEGGSTSTFTILPGQMFALLNAQGAIVTNIGDGFFTTTTTAMSFGAGTIYGVVKIGSDGLMISTEFTRTSQASFTVTVASGSTVGIIQFESESRRVITSIGGASFITRTLTSISSSSSVGSVGLLDITGSASALFTTTSKPAITTPQPPIAGFAIDCTLNQLHQFPLDCSRFYQCYGENEDRTVYIFPCAPGLVFDEATSQCLTPSEGACDDITSITDPASSSEGVGGFFQINCSGDLYRYPLNCNNFYQCFENDKGQETIYVYSCATGLVFDESSRTCRLPNEASSCAVNSKLFRSPSILFQLKQKIDVVSLIPSSRTLVQQKTLSASSSVSEVSFSQPHQTGRGSTKRKMGYTEETEQKVDQRRIHTELRQGKESKSTVTVTGNFRPRLFDSGVYGVRISPLSKSLFGQSKPNENK
ncbi:mucin-3A isoform X2 [Daphnia magna]|uniref:mucin-3A isoform X2 n=1 Tax=Daphnia magna TaxID=35525 RepID=UPI001E1BC3D0|nr:mucin-3A isoform X2 [Daphnia magna]